MGLVQSVSVSRRSHVTSRRQPAPAAAAQAPPPAVTSPNATNRCANIAANPIDTFAANQHPIGQFSFKFIGVIHGVNPMFIFIKIVHVSKCWMAEWLAVLTSDYGDARSIPTEVETFF